MSRNDAEAHAAQPPRLFISYARGDGRDFVERFEARLAAEGLTSWRDLRDVEGGEDILPQVLQAIEAAEHLILILTPRALRSGWVKAEWTHARALGRKVSPVLGAPNLRRSDLPPWVRRTDVYDPDEPERWAKLIAVLRRDGRARRVPYHIGHLPDSFVPRPGPYDRLKKGILEADGGVVGLSTALIGAGGYGKTTLANALCRDEDVRFEFSDGVLRVEIGKERTDVLGLISDLIETLDPGGQRPGFTDVDVAAEQLAHRLDKARLLLVLDDVWRESQVRPFLRGGPNCVRLITTRNPRVLDQALRIDVDELTKEEALALLCWRLPGRSPAAVGELRALATRLEGWAQMIEIANGWLRSRIRAGRDLDSALEDFTRRLDRRGLTAFDPRDADARNRAIGLCVDASLEDLTKVERARFAELATLPEDTDTPIDIVAALWAQTGGIDDMEAEDLLDRLADLSLLQRLDLGQQTVRLHDNMKWLLGDRLGAAGTQAAHGAMTEALLARAGGTWSAAPVEDSYTWRHAPAHLRAAGRTEAADALLLEYGWIAGRLAALGATSLVEAGRPEPAAEDARLVARALALSVAILRENPKQLSLQLSGRLLDLPVGRIPSLLGEASRNSSHSATPKRAFLTPPGPERLRLTGHAGAVAAAATSPDGASIVMFCFDCAARVLDAETGAETACLQGHESMVVAVNFSPDGTRIATASKDATARVWDTRTGTEIATMRGHQDEVVGVTFSSDGTRIATASKDATARVWDARTGTEIATMRGHQDEVAGVTFCADGTRIVTASKDATARVWDLETGAETTCLRGHEHIVNAVAVSPDSARIATASVDNTVRVWNAETGAETACLRGHEHAVLAVAFSRDGTSVATASVDYTARVWDAETGAEIACLRGHDGWVLSVDFSPDGARIATASNDATARVWNAETGAETACLRGHEHEVKAALFSPDGSRITTVDYYNVRIWDSSTSFPKAELTAHEKRVSAIAVSHSGARIASGSEDGTTRVWNAETGAETVCLRGHDEKVTAVAVSPDGARIATAASRDDTPRVWDAETGAEIACLRGHENMVNSIAFSPDGAKVATASIDGTARVWQANTGIQTACIIGYDCGVQARLKELWNVFLGLRRFYRGVGLTHRLRTMSLMWRVNRSQQREVRVVVFSPDCTRIATVSKNVRIWDADNGNEIACLCGHEDMVEAIAFSPDSARIATASKDKKARVWDAETGAETACLRGHDGWVVSVTFSPDGARIATASNDATARLWDTDTGAEIACLNPEQAVFDMRDVAFFPDGTRIAIAGTGGNALLWDLHDPSRSDQLQFDSGVATLALGVKSHKLAVGDLLGRLGIFDLDCSE